MHFFQKGFNMLQSKLVSKSKDKNETFSKLKIDLKIFDKNGKIQSNKMINLSSILKKI